MNTEPCAFVICPHCNTKTPTPMLLRDYEWKNKTYSTTTGIWYCVHCGDSFSVRAVRGVTKVEVVNGD